MDAGYGRTTFFSRFDFTVEEGEFVAAVGPNGAGKTTLLRVFTGSLPLWGGNVRVMGTDIGQMPPRLRGRILGVVAQERDARVPLTVREVVLLGRLPHLSPLAPLSSVDAAAVERALHELALNDFAHRPFHELSGGERQRVMLARALAQQPRILLLDEPTAHLDLSFQKEIMDSLLRWRREKGITVLLTMHNLSLAGAYADRLVLLDAGRIVADGKPCDVLTVEILEPVYRTRMRLADTGGRAPVITVIPEENNA